MTDEQRDCFRIPNSQENWAIIKIRRKEIRVRLIDQSASGFAVASDALSRVALGRRVQLRTASGWSETVVVRQETEDGQTVLGLSRLADLPDARQTRNASGTPRWQPVAVVSRSLLSSLLAVFICSALVFWLFVAGVAWFAEPNGRGQKQFDVTALIQQVWDQAEPSVRSPRQSRPIRLPMRSIPIGHSCRSR